LQALLSPRGVKRAAPGSGFGGQKSHKTTGVYLEAGDGRVTPAAGAGRSRAQVKRGGTVQRPNGEEARVGKSTGEGTGSCADRTDRSAVPYYARGY